MRRSLSALLAVSVLSGMVGFVGPIVARAAYPTGSYEVSGDKFSVVVDGVTNHAVTMDNQNFVSFQVSTDPATVNVGISCGGCDASCGDFCADEWGFCHCTGVASGVVPKIILKDAGDSSVASAELAAGNKLEITSIANGTTTIVLQAQFEGLLPGGGVQGERFSPEYSIAIEAKNITPKTRLSSPSNLAIAEGGSTLGWDAVENAIGYTVQAVNKNNTTVYAAQSVTTNAIDVNTFTPTVRGGDYLFTVKAIADKSGSYVDSAFSAQSAVYRLAPVKLETPKNVMYNSVSKELSWNAVPNVDDGYKVIAAPVDGGEIKTFKVGNNNTTYLSLSGYLSSLADGEYRLSVVAGGKPTYINGTWDENWNYIETEVPAAYSDSDPSDCAPENLFVSAGASQMTVNAAWNSYDGKIVYLQSNNKFDLTDFDPENSGITLTVNGVVNPVERAAYLRSTHTQIAVYFENPMPSDAVISLVLDGGTLMGEGGLTFQDFVVQDRIYFNLGGAEPGFFGLDTYSSSNTVSEGEHAFFNGMYNVTSKVYDDAGNLYFSDTGNYAIYKIDAVTSMISRIAGTKSAPSASTVVAAGTTVKALETAIYPSQIVLDESGTRMYVASRQSGASQVYKIDLASGDLTLVAGAGPSTIPETGNGDGGPAASAIIPYPSGVALDSAGNVYIAEWSGGYGIRKVDKTTGMISKVAGVGSANWKTVDANGNSSIAALNAANGNGGDPLQAVMRPQYLKIIGDVLYIADYTTTSYQLRKIDMTKSPLKIEVVAGAPRGAIDALPLADGVDSLKANFGGYVTDYTFAPDGTMYLTIYGSDANGGATIWSVNPSDRKMYKIGGGASGSMSSYLSFVKAANIRLSGNSAGALDYRDGALTLFYYASGSRGFATLIPPAAGQSAQRLATPAGLTIENDMLSWQPVAGAKRYLVEFVPMDGGGAVEVSSSVRNDTKLNISSAFAAKLAAKPYTVRVTAQGYENSVVYSDSAPATMLYTGTSYKAGHVVIAEVYGGGGVTGSSYKNDYIVLYNPTDEVVALNGWSVASYNASTSDLQGTFTLSGQILPHGYYLIAGASAPEGIGKELPAPDVIDESIDIQSMLVRVALLSDSEPFTGLADPALVDLVGSDGYIYEGRNYSFRAAKPTSLLESLVRKDNHGGNPINSGRSDGNGWDTDNNQSDFVVTTTQTPRNSTMYGPKLAGAISGTASISGSTAGKTLTASANYTFTDTLYSEESIAKTYYYWYADGKLQSIVADHPEFTADLPVGTSVRVGVQKLFANGELSNIILSDSILLTSDEEAAKMISYSASTNHGGEVIGGLDDQWINLTVHYSKEIDLTDDKALIDELKIMLNGSESLVFGNTPNTGVSADYPGYAKVKLGEDKKSLVFEVHFGFAPYAGNLTVTAPGGITAVKDAESGANTVWEDIDFFAPNGVRLETVGQTAARPDDGINASVTKKVITPASATRGMVHMLFLKNGVPVGTVNTYGGNIVTHYHNYLTLNADSYAAMIPGWFSAFKNDYDLTVDGDTVTITAKSSEEGDVLDLRIYAYPQDRDTHADKRALLAKISGAEALDEAEYSKASYAELWEQLALAKAVGLSPYYLQAEVDAAAAALQESIDGLAPAGNDVIPGDVDGNGEVSVLDIMFLRKLILNGTATERQLAAGDLSGSGTLEAVDIMLLRKLLLQKL